MSSALEFKEVSFQYDRKDVLSNLTMDVAEGEIHGLLGASGCGKTTLLRLAAGLERVKGGQVYIGGQRVSALGKHLRPAMRNVAMVFQDYALFPHINVRENIKMAYRGDHFAKSFEKLMCLLKIEDLASSYPHEISGGQQQRVAIARSLIASPKVLLMDEPFSHIDLQIRGELLTELRELFKLLGTSVLFVTHDQQEALQFSDTLGVMQGGQIVQVGAPQFIYRHPKTPGVAKFLGRGAFLPLQWGGRGAYCDLGPVNVDPHRQGGNQVFLRPEDLRLAAKDHGEEGATLLSRHFVGNHYIVHMRLPTGNTLYVQCEAHSDWEVGKTFKVELVRPDPIVFN